MIGFYGGSFNPVHTGHIEVGRFLLKSPNIEKIFLTPVFKHPFKKKLAPFDDRVAMIELAIKNEKGLYLSKDEEEKGGVSYTYDLLHYLKKKYGNEFFFIGGLDTLNSIDKWKNWEYIISNFNILFTTRANVKIDEKRIKQIENISGKKVNPVSKVEELNPEGLNLIDVPFIPVSSTDIRRMLKRGEDLSGILHPDVISYIYQRKLYGG